MGRGKVIRPSFCILEGGTIVLKLKKRADLRPSEKLVKGAARDLAISAKKNREKSDDLGVSKNAQKRGGGLLKTLQENPLKGKKNLQFL